MFDFSTMVFSYTGPRFTHLEVVTDDGDTSLPVILRAVWLPPPIQTGHMPEQQAAARPGSARAAVAAHLRTALSLLTEESDSDSDDDEFGSGGSWRMCGERGRGATGGRGPGILV